MLLSAQAWRVALSTLVLLALIAVSGKESATASGPLLYGVTGEGGGNPESLFSINQQTAETQLLEALGNGGDGEEIAYAPDDDRILHASGRAEDMILEWIDRSTLEVIPVDHGGDDCDEISGLTYVGDGTFLASTIDWLLCSITSDGTINEVARVDTAEILTGLAWVNGRLYATEWGENTHLYGIDPETGEITSIVDLEVDADGFRLMALTGHPCSHQLYAVMAIGRTEIRQPMGRSLVTINPSSGRVTIIGDLGENIAGIAFAGDQCEEAGAAPGTSGTTPTSPLLTTTPTGATSVRPPSTGDGGLVLVQR